MIRKLQHLLRLIYRFGIFNAIKIHFNDGGVLQLKGLHPIHLRPHTSDVPTFYQIFLRNEYDIQLPITPSFIIDAGANIGLSVIHFKSKYPHATIVAIEPDSKNVEILKKNTAHYENLFIEHRALWSAETSLNVIDKFGMGSWAMVTEELEGDTNKMGVKTITLNEIVKKFQVKRIDLLKIDIETAEKNLFSTNYETWLSITKVIIIELHDRLEPGCSKVFFEAINRMFKDYTYLTLSENTIIINNDI